MNDADVVLILQEMVLLFCRGGIMVLLGIKPSRMSTNLQ